MAPLSNFVLLGAITLLRVLPSDAADSVSFSVYSDKGDDGNCVGRQLPDYTLYNDDDNNGSGCVPWEGGGPYADGGVFSGDSGPSYPGAIYFYDNDLCSDQRSSANARVTYSDYCTLVGGGDDGRTIGGVCWTPTDHPHDNCSGGGIARKRGLGGMTAYNSTGERK